MAGVYGRHAVGPDMVVDVGEQHIMRKYVMHDLQYFEQFVTVEPPIDFVELLLHLDRRPQQDA
jgi:hypothetical protein